MAESLDEFLIETDGPDRTLRVVGPTQPEPIRNLFSQSFGGLGVALGESNDGGFEEAVVLTEGGDVVATSSMESIRNAILLVNSDLYSTGLSGIDKYDAPAVLTELDETVYTLRGFPASTKEKLLLIVMSRYIERRALEVGAGRLDVAFQHLSRIEDEYGTGTIYRRLSETDLDVHAYGIPDTTLTGYDDVTVHTGRSEPYRRSWFVVFTPPADRERAAALVAVETGRNVWRAMWTYESDRVEAIQRHVIETF